MGLCLVPWLAQFCLHQITPSQTLSKGKAASESTDLFMSPGEAAYPLGSLQPNKTVKQVPAVLFYGV